MRIVLDTNVLVRALLSPGGPAGAINELLTAEVLGDADVLATLDRHFQTPISWRTASSRAFAC